MGSTKATPDLISTVRSIVGDEYSDMDVIRALHLASNDPTAAINIMFDTPTLRKPEIRHRNTSPKANNSGRNRNNTERDGNLESVMSYRPNPPNPRSGIEGGREESGRCSSSMGSEWWLLGCGEVYGLSTCKGRRVRAGDTVDFRFPAESKIGRIPNEWARCLLPLVRDKKVLIEGCCKSAPDVLGVMDSILLSVSVYINSSMFRKSHQTLLKAASSTADESVVHPLPTLFKLLGLIPFKKAEFTPGDLCTRKRSYNSKDSSCVPATFSHANNFKNPSLSGNKVEDEESVSETDLDNIVGVGDSSELEEMEPPSTLQCELHPYQKQALHWMIKLEKGQCMDEAGTTLHPCWEAYFLADKREFVVYVNPFSGDATVEFPSILQMARGGVCSKTLVDILIACICYLDRFKCFDLRVQLKILADAMGLGKTIMTIALLLAHSERGGSLGSESTSQTFSGSRVAGNASHQSPALSTKAMKFPGFHKLAKQKNSLIGGGNLIICPMTLLGQWKAEIETHAQPGSLSIYVHYGQSRPKDASILAQSDVVLTTYGVLASEFSAENADDNGGLYSVRWFRVVLDEAHTIKSSKSQVSLAAAALLADRRWCLTGTPIQNNLEDIYSLLRFLRVEPWGSWAWWSRLVQKPFEEGDERGLKLVQTILRPIMLRRTKFSTDQEGRPILLLPPAHIEVIYCELNEAERDFYEALFKRSKVKFDQFVEQGRVLHNYASILELLLRLRQCCDHPFLVMSRGDTQEYSDLNKLAKRFLKGGRGIVEGEVKDMPSRAYIQEVVEELRKGEQGECPICLEAFEDAVLTPCAHRLCRECLMASWRSPASGLCPVCRKIISKNDLITAPTDSRFQIDIEKNWVESSKVAVLLHELENHCSSGSKSVVFSQWTAFLDLLQIPLARSNIPFVRLDGTLNQQQREKVIKQFSEESNVLVLLMSLKAGGVGINLTAASNAFVLDPWWNPAVEEQAVMRIHRIGQTKNVNIRRFIVKGTVEERMEAVQARKQRMISGALTDQEVRTARIEELKMLFT
ncbi:hypothetical protein RJ640_025026 [Escallonia rubra]|uniref:DNA/RNA helicase protein n=1 Tax=Escallonia rubra TaxID=112253 RepID=A0AA88R899_9ASTE|nr:hypothetical protein RJ640_025026 [Escallonia rubra]